MAGLAQLGREQDREPGLVELDAGPERLAAGEIVLRPMAVGQLDRDHVGENAPGVVNLVGGKQGEGGQRRVARPHQMIAAEGVGAVSPRRAHAGDGSARKHAVFVGLEHRRRHQRLFAEPGIGRRQVELAAPTLPPLEELLPDRLVALGQG